MHFSKFVSLALATAVSGLAIEPLAGASSLAARNGNQCPSGFGYCGWFDQSQNYPPHCAPSHPNPGPIACPSCPSGQAPYCARDPGHFCPYDEGNDFCANDGISISLCIDIDLDISGVEHLLGGRYCPEDKAFRELGSGCVAGGSCGGSWLHITDLGCTVEELLVFTVGAVVSILDIL